MDVQLYMNSLSSRSTARIDSFDSLTITPNYSSHLISPLDSTQRPHRADEFKFLLVIQYVYVYESIGEYSL